MTEPIRTATTKDAPARAAIIKSWNSRTDWMPNMASVQELQGMLRADLPLRETCVIGDPITGYISLETDISYIWGGHVAKPRNGFGRSLRDRVKQDHTCLQLNTHNANTTASAFYASQEFVQTGPPWMGSDRIDEIRMEWQP